MITKIREKNKIKLGKLVLFRKLKRRKEHEILPEGAKVKRHCIRISFSSAGYNSCIIRSRLVFALSIILM